MTSPVPVDGEHGSDHVRAAPAVTALADLRSGRMVVDTATGAVWRIVELRRTNPYLGPVVELERHNAGRARVSVSAEQLIHDGARAQVARWRSLAESPPGGAA